MGEDGKNEAAPFTVEQFYRFIGEKRLMAARCDRCGILILPPRPLCMNCLSTDLRWVELKKKGKLLTYTVIYVAPAQFQSMAPYAYGIVELEDGPHLPGIIQGLRLEDIKVGMELEVGFETGTPSNWPQWPRYFFRQP